MNERTNERSPVRANEWLKWMLKTLSQQGSRKPRTHISHRDGDSNGGKERFIGTTISEQDRKQKTNKLWTKFHKRIARKANAINQPRVRFPSRLISVFRCTRDARIPWKSSQISRITAFRWIQFRCAEVKRWNVHEKWRTTTDLCERLSMHWRAFQCNGDAFLLVQMRSDRKPQKFKFFGNVRCVVFVPFYETQNIDGIVRSQVATRRMSLLSFDIKQPNNGEWRPSFLFGIFATIHWIECMYGNAIKPAAAWSLNLIARSFSICVVSRFASARLSQCLPHQNRFSENRNRKRK